MTYRVRKQALTGKLVLQHDMTAGGWTDADAKALPFDKFEAVDSDEYMQMLRELDLAHDRIERYERRAAASKKSRAARAQPKETPA